MMLVVKVEVWPGGRENMKRELARARIGNVSNLANTSDYVVTAKEGDNSIVGTPAWESKGRLDGHDRRQSVWALVAKAAAWAAEVTREVQRE
jgi:hypothetical protein